MKSIAFVPTLAAFLFGVGSACAEQNEFDGSKYVLDLRQMEHDEKHDDDEQTLFMEVMSDDRTF